MEEFVGRDDDAFRYAHRDIRAYGVNSGSVFRVDEIAAYLNVGINATVARATITSGLRRNLNRFMVISERLIYVPSILVVTAIDIGESRRSIVCHGDRFVFGYVADRHDVVRFGIRLRVLIRSIDFRRPCRDFNVRVVLVLDQLRQFKFGRRDAYGPFTPNVVTNSNRRLDRVFFLALLVYVRWERVPFASAPRRMVKTARFSNDIGDILCLSDDTNGRVGFKIYDDPIRVTYVAGGVYHAPWRFSSNFDLFLFNVDGCLFRVHFVFLSYVNFLARIRVVRAVVFSSRFLRRFGTNVRLVLNDLRLVNVTIPERFLYSTTGLIATLNARDVPPYRDGLRPIFRLLTICCLFDVVVARHRQILAFLAFGFGLSCAKGVLFYDRGSLLVLVAYSGLSAVFFRRTDK